MFVSRARQLVAEGVGTALLLATVVGSGIMAERLCGGNPGLALLCNTLPTGAIYPYDGYDTTYAATVVIAPP